MSLLLLLAAFSVHAAPVPLADPAPDAREGPQAIRVAPLLVLGPLPDLGTVGFFGEPLQGREAGAREAREAALFQVPSAFGVALPGEVALALPPGWDVCFRDTDLALPVRARVTQALQEDEAVEDALRSAAARSPGEVVLFRWMADVSALALNGVTVPASTTRAGDRLVFVDASTDPVLVSATLGVALVASDGEIRVLHSDRYEAVLSSVSGPRAVGRSLARHLVADVATRLAREDSMAGGAGYSERP
ncbi:MAG: hypothetical protein JXB39_03555 [Deltaproteobacteria bacterium]|nr:hypothetical protein [Deltaproteobacteria bacterium]